MPIYEYFCSECGRQSEITHRMSDPPAKDCPLCGKPALTKQMSAAGFRLKGAGWYETDFKSDGKRNLAGDSSTASSTAEAPAAKETKTETKAAEAAPAAKPAAPAPAA